METSADRRSQINRSKLKSWREDLKPLNVDIVGDFAGGELFAIHGEALLLHCIQTARVDFDYGFQLLHAVHAVESFLSKLSDRGCNFHILWFDIYADHCIPASTSSQNSHRYLLARAVIIQHFARVTREEFSYRFQSMYDDRFSHYKQQNPLNFIMCYDYGATDLDITSAVVDRLSVGYQMASAGICVAFINDVEFRSSKVNTRVVTPSRALVLLTEYKDPPRRESTSKFRETIELLRRHWDVDSLTTRDVITLHTLSQMLTRDSKGLRLYNICAILVQLVMLRHCGLSQRSFPPIVKNHPSHSFDMMEEFCKTALSVMDVWDQGDHAAFKWDAFDLFDGSLYWQSINRCENLVVLPEKLMREFTDLSRLLKILCGVDIADTFSDLQKEAGGVKDVQAETRVNSSFSVLPFSHPVINQYLDNVHLSSDENPEPTGTSQVFQELTHWHNDKKPVDPKHIPKHQGFFARRRNQRFMADTIAYSASLTGSSGKNIDPEIIVVQPSTKGKRPQASQNIESGWRAAARQKQSGKSSKRQKKSGKQMAHEAVETRKAEKIEEKSMAVISNWTTFCLDLEKRESLMTRYLVADKFLRTLPKAHSSFIGAEASLYLCHVLNMMRDEKELPRLMVSEVMAMLWSQIIETSRYSLTPDVAAGLIKLAGSLNITLDIAPSSPIRTSALPFTISEARSTSVGIVRPIEFQLNHCGPFMERGFDSAPDARVPFHPDAWQRKVLDAIDADKSLFVVAPTSAGKTFISFYAMKKVLQANDNDIIVYVAPTKALVNQIAAEVQARFSKSYHNHDGRSVWAIHTRDYRVNNPNGCQVLVTIPHILQIMLLAPSNASTPNSWSRRVKRIIFDEVHCIGQSEDGVIWEQLLLLAPCPIIALSATVGNPVEFKMWLEGTQKVKGFELEMITHGSRYSDLRKFIYEPPEECKFEGLKRVDRLPFPGLDSCTGSKGGERFIFIHPIASLLRKDVAALNDLSLEPRDCLGLWRLMQQYCNDCESLPQALDPRRFFTGMIKKSDVVAWEHALKQHLGGLMLYSSTQFEAVQRRLQSPLRGAIDTSRTNSSRPPKFVSPYFSLVLDLYSSGALPAIIFNFDRTGCESIVVHLLRKLESAEVRYQEGSEWKAKMAAYEKWKKADSKMQAKLEKRSSKRQSKDDEGLNKLDQLRDKASQEDSPWKLFDPGAPLAEYSFANSTKISKEELEERLKTLENHPVKPEFISALRRGLGVHHAGMNRQYRQAVEMLFRKGYLTIVVATGTLALGLNMPCKTVVFAGDSAFLTALQYRQASGRAGRRGFDNLGNVVFHDIPVSRVLQIMASKLPKLQGQFPTSVTLILRLFSLLHGTNNSEYACNAVKSLLSQNRLYLGGPKTKLSIEHHLRFSIDYLRRQHLLSETGAPLNFSGLVGHLYYTENAAFAFHSLLKEGFFNEICSGTTHKEDRESVLMLVLCHLFCRIPCTRYKETTWIDNVVRKSPSLVLLPDLPLAAAQILKKHNKETLHIFQNYVSTYATQHLSNVPDNQLPFTKHIIEPEEPYDIRGILQPNPPTIVASPFAALSNITDEFETIGDLCRFVRAGVFLEESTIPFIPVAPDETGGVPWNAYIYDFYKHGDLKALVRDNGIKSGDVWFRLKDFSLILATIVTSLGNFLNHGASEADDDAAMIDVQDAGDIVEENAGIYDTSDDDGESDMRHATANISLQPTEAAVLKGKKSKKKAVLDSWEDAEMSDTSTHDEDDSNVHYSSSGGKSEPRMASPRDSAQPSWHQERQGGSLAKVYNAFSMLRADFDTKFLKIWA